MSASSRLRVLHVDSGREMRGGQWQVVRLIEGLLAVGVECTLLAGGEGPLLGEARLRGWQAKPLSWARLFREARRHQVVHVHDAHAHTMATFCGGAPVVVSRRVAFPIRWAWKYRRAAHVVAVSGFVGRIVAEAGVAPAHISVVYDAVPLPEIPQGPRSGVVAVDNAADPMKGAAVVARAAELAGIPVKFSRDLEHDLAHAAIFVYVTHSEGLGSAALLAMSMGAAVVASEVGGLPEIVQNEDTGLLVENTPQAVAGALRRLLEHPDQAQRFARAARLRIESDFSIERMVKRTMEIYQQVRS